MSLKVLTSAQVEQFIELGYTLLSDAFPREVAAAVRRAVLAKIDASEDNPATWTKRRNHIADSFGGEPFMSACTARYNAALDDLMGEGRWIPIQNLGWWPVLFPGFDAPPWRSLNDEWHIDGGFFHHHLDSPEQGMLPIFVFSDIGPGDGGTAIAVGSHKVAARVLRDAQPDGLPQGELSKRVKEEFFRGGRGFEEPGRVIEAQCRAGDIVLLHPFMLHTVSTNTGKSIRIICNPHVNFTERMNVTGNPVRARDASIPLSPVERAIGCVTPNAELGATIGSGAGIGPAGISQTLMDEVDHGSADGSASGTGAGAEGAGGFAGPVHPGG